MVCRRLVFEHRRIVKFPLDASLAIQFVLRSGRLPLVALMLAALIGHLSWFYIFWQKPFLKMDITVPDWQCDVGENGAWQFDNVARRMIFAVSISY